MSLVQVFGGRGKATELEPLGVIDIGSNSVRLVVYEGAVRSALPIFNEKVLCGLGKSIATTGKLGVESVERALEALRRFNAIARILKVKNLRVLATAAVREAEDGQSFIQMAEKAAGVRVEVLSGEKEAQFAAYGIRMGFLAADGLAGDLGGGSLEVIDIYKDRLNDAVTLPLGGLRLIDQTGNKIDRALPLVDEALAQVKWLTHGRGRPFYAVGGTWRALAKLHMEQTNYPLRVMHGYAIPTREAIEFCQFVRRTKKVSALPGMDDVARARRDVVPYGALVLERLLEALAPSEVVFSVFGIREGLLFSLMTPHEQAKDPLLCYCEDYARLRSRSLEHARELCTWTDTLFEGDGPKETEDDRRLRHAACLLSDIGWRAHPDHRGEQSLDVVAHAGFAGIDHPGRIFLALAVYYRHVGTDDGKRSDDLAARLRLVVSKRAQKRARIIGAAVRAAHMLSIGMPGVIDETKLFYEGPKLVLTIPRTYAALDGERLRRRFGLLAELLAREAEIRVAN
ncbi:MAG TPA: Ppx/GppA phosphatase family protein [Hyphomicrobium sp.]|nr:Ppx/GppA phosphatase family protein [Hyphomicrobium sp.]HEX2842011.1 Ppx/GppA phosphatase family protein [Hyphomicrobium sp.]